MRRALAYTAIGIVVVALAMVYYFFDPATSGWAPKCFFRTVTGYECPGCGSQRMLHALLHGDWASAWHANPFLLCALPVLALMTFAALTRKRFPALYARVNSVPVIVVVFILITGWTIFRNL